MENNEVMMTVAELAKTLRCSVASIYSKIYNKTLDIPYLRMGKMTRFRKADVDMWLEKKVNEPKVTK